MNRTEQIQLAASLMKWTEEKAESLCREKKELEALYFCEGGKGGASLLVSKTGEVLYADSSISPEEFFEAFAKGIRTDKSCFA